MNVVLKLR